MERRAELDMLSHSDNPDDLRSYIVSLNEERRRIYELITHPDFALKRGHESRSILERLRDYRMPGFPGAQVEQPAWLWEDIELIKQMELYLDIPRRIEQAQKSIERMAKK